MTKQKKSKFNTQWATPNVEVTDKTNSNKKSATDNQWTTTNKKSLE
ncbi:hypothetical protein J9303_17845 [Bacillaceae bacterium Marseille-Q3522]|nr:hypothetical protein [Bacillaceae bacterium Marseille-Q3522]